MKYIKTSVLATLFLLTTAIAAPIVDGSLSAISDGTSITIRWRSEDETDVARYEIERKAGVNGQFIPLVAISLRGNSSAYEYVDDSAFRITESIYQYQVKVVFANGAAPIYYGPITVRHDVSSVNRTWGSIKAMFR
ncbi:MAG: hypothetical protein ACKVRP_06445 [Bacteroidota bacterium]